MRVLAAFDKCKGSLSAHQMCSLASAALKEHKEIELETIPLTDGGDGFVEILTKSVGGEFLSTEVRDSVGELIQVSIGICSLDDLPFSARSVLKIEAEQKIAVLEMACVVGLANLKESERNPWETSTCGVGELLGFVSELGVDLIVLGIGGSSTNDAGLGAMSALGLQMKDGQEQIIENPKPRDWSRVKKIESLSIRKLPRLVIACDVENTLLGCSGATYGFALQKGLPASELEEMEKSMEAMVELLKIEFEQVVSLKEQKGSGAAGGLAFGLGLCYDIQMISGFSLLSNWFDIPTKMKCTDLVLTGEGKFDDTSLLGKAPFQILKMASDRGIETKLIAGKVEESTANRCRELYPLCSFESFSRMDLSLEENFARAEEFFEEKIKHLFN